jgi:hypothetical protein
MPKRVINSLEEQEDIKTATHEAGGHKPREATFHKIADYF